MAANTDHLEHTNIYSRDLDDSEESDGEGGLGNLNRLIVRPPGHSGKAKRGQLCFDAAFECGNLGRADHITELEYDLYIRPDTCRPRSRFWYNFTVENVKQDQRVIFNIVNLGKERTLYDGDMTPLVRSTSRHKWQRIPRRLIFYHRSAAHRGRKVLSLAFAFDREEDVYQFAAAAPYSFSRLQKYLTAWEKKAQAFATRESIAQTTQKRRVDLITIGDFTVEKEVMDDVTPITKSKVPEPKKRVVLIIARAHGGEHPASYICQGFLDYIVSSSEKARALRNGIAIQDKKVVINQAGLCQVVPMLNPDGVFLGNQRSDLLGSDLNRCWHRATSYAHPALIAVNDVVKKLRAEKAIQLDFIIDIHADNSHEGVFIRGNSYDDIFRFERHAVLPKFLAARVEAWQPQNCLYNADIKALGSARRSLPFGTVDAYTLLASLGGRRLNPRGPYLHYTEDAYLKIGRSLVKALCDYYRHIGVIPQRVPVAKKEPRGRRRRRKPVYEREGSPSSSTPERRVLATRVLSPELPPASPPAMRGPPGRAPRHALLRVRPRPVVVPELLHVLPVITGHAVQTPRLAVVDLSAHIQPPRAAHGPPRPARPPRPSHPRLTSDEYTDTQDSDI
ncbi:cytosolic carboxypeptidase 6-like [Pectinophora gossypiella]|uniref:cytosolic carboxypeptidase 6-like n=1 Tax=Pectinophora gossypiella TaxID=13191 RepID=UPI00214E450E|nr:cytosolic carboxypeptidase 6-like [Pectinophora gossypiella]